MELDTNRRVLWLMGGFASICTTCEDYNGSNGTYVLRDNWKYHLNSTPTNNTWTNVCGTIDGSKNPVHCPGTTSNFPRYGGTVYDYHNDVHYKMGWDESNFFRTWISCPTPVGGGGITARQTALGCTGLNRWDNLSGSVTGTPPNGGEDVAWFPTPFIDNYHGGKILVFVGNGGGLRRLYLFNQDTKTYTSTATSGIPLSGLTDNVPESSYIRLTSGPWAGNYLYIKTLQQASGTPTHTTYFYNVRANTLTALSVTGTGPGFLAYNGWDHGELKIVSSSYPPHTLRSAALLRQN
jgi:hypothetical protein